MARSFDLEQAAPPSASSAGTADRPARCNPYVGPRSLRYGERIYGRDREARQLLDLLIAERIVLLYSPSGAGKTSLIQAGLIPELEKEEFHVLPVIRVGRGATDRQHPCNPYVMSVLLSLEQDVPPEQAIPPEELASMSLGEYLQRREATDGTNDGTFLIFDQFEEILTIDPLNRAAKTDFFNQVGDALRNMKRWALFAMREDHVAALDPYLRPIPTRLKSTFRLDLLNTTGARVAVQQPARDCGVEFTEEATTKLVDDLRQVAVQGPTGAAEQQLGLYIEPVQLQVVCYRLWEKLGPNVKEITAEQVVGTGDVDSALADYYAERVAQISAQSGVKERVIREWFGRRLITESGIRSQVMQGSENSRELNEEAIQLLVNVHLIRGEERRGVMWLELAHDRLVKPIRANNAAWSEKNLSVLQHQAAVWHAQGRPDSLCLRGKARMEAQAWADEHANELTETEREFMESCQRNHDARKNKWAAAAVTVLTVVVAIISALALLALNESRTSKKERQTAEGQRQMAERERNIATARSMAAHALQIQGQSLDAALLLATEAQKLSDQPGTRGALLATAFYNPRLITFLQGSTSPLGSSAFNASGTQLATGDYDGKIVLWNVEERRTLEVISDFVKGPVRSVAFSPNGRYFAASASEGSLALRDLRGDPPRKILHLPSEFAHKGNVWDLSFSGDSASLASAGNDGKVVVWNIAAGAFVALPAGVDSRGDPRIVRAVAFHPDGAMLAAGCADGTLLLWSRESDGWIPVKRTFPTGPSDRPRVTCLAFSHDGQYLAAGRRSGAVDLYDVSASGETAPLLATGMHNDVVSDLAFSSDGQRVISSSFDGTLQLWELPAMEANEPPFVGHVGRVLSVAFSPDNQTVASGGNDRRAILWDSRMHVATPKRTEAFPASFSIAFSPDGKYEADGYDDGHVNLKTWNETGMPPTIMPPRNGPKFVPIVTFSANSQRIAATTADGKILIQNVGAEPRRTVEIDAVDGNVRKDIDAISLNNDGSLIAAGLSGKGVTGQVRIWTVATREPLPIGPFENGVDDVFNAVEFSPDDSRLATGGKGEFACIWSLAANASTRLVRCPGEHTGTIRSIAFSPDGRIFATASGDTTLILWDAVTGVQVAPPLIGHQAPVVAAAFSADGALLASGSDDTTVILWDVGTKQPTGRLTGHTYSVRALAFSPDGKRLFSGSWDGESHQWELDPNELQKICRQRANRNLTPTEWTAYIGGKYQKTWESLPTPGDSLLPK